MTSNLRLGWMSIPTQAISISANQTIEQNGFLGSSNSNPQWSLMNKFRHVCTRLATFGTNLNFTYDTGNTNSKTCNFLAAIRCDLLNRAGINIDIKLQRSSDNVTYTDIDEINLTSSYVYDSPRNDDAIITFTDDTSTNRYYRIKIDAGSSDGLISTGYFFGQLFDFDLDPEIFDPKFPINDATFESDNGTEHFSITKPVPYEFVITWEGVSDQKIKDFELIVGEIEKTGVLLYSANSDFTDGFKLVHCDLMTYEYDRVWTNYNNITLVLKEILP